MPFRDDRTHSARVATAALGFVLALVALPAAGASVPAQYLVFEVEESGTVEPVFLRAIETSGPLRSKSRAELDAASPAAIDEGSLVRILLEGADGAVVFRDLAELPRWRRGEFHGAGGEIEAHRFAARTRAFVQRLPAIEGARLIIEGRRRSTFDLDALRRDAAELPLAGVHPTGPVASRVAGGGGSGGDPANRVDLLILGDGYTAAQQSLFDADAAGLENAFFGITPYSQYRNFVNVTRLFVASPEAGADHPPYQASCSGNGSCCGDTAALSDPLAGTYVDTAFGALYCTANIHRLLSVHESAVLAAASAVPEWDQLLMLVNDDTYGGSGGLFSVTSTASAAVEIARHEYGHTFTDLADEYESPFPGFPTCSDITGPPCEANVTDETGPGLIKWAPWIAPSTPVPTPETSNYNGVVGLFQGARYRSTGMYRPRNSDCLMRALGRPFGQICSQEYVLALYRGGWGDPASGIDLIEPGSESPPTGGVIDGTSGVNFSVDLLLPQGSPTAVTWLVDGVPQPAATSSFQFQSGVPGTYTVEIRVEDGTVLVHPEMEGQDLISSRSWTVAVGGSAVPGRIDGVTLGRAPGGTGTILIAWPASCSDAATDYAIYEGAIGDWYSHKRRDCTDDGSPLSEELVPAPADSYYLVVPLTPDNEGSYGTDSGGTERPRGLATCAGVQSLIACP